jgi:MFS family permease
MRHQTRLLVQISAAHLVSHFHVMTVPALLPVLPDVMKVSFVDLGIALGVFNIVSALCQAPLGFAVDRFGGRRVLMLGLAVGSFGFALLAAAPTYPILLVAMAIAGFANGVYHPADYALLSQGMDAGRMGRAFSIHTFAGFLGGAIAPPIIIGLAFLFDVRWAFASAVVVGLVALIVVWRGPRVMPAAREAAHATAQKGDARRPARAARSTILVLTILFMMLSLNNGALERFSVTALVQGFDVSLSIANIALTALLFASAVGVLAGGVLADRTEHHGFVAAIAFVLAALLVTMVILVRLPDPVLILTLGATGFLTGIVVPSRDMLVRAASPAGQEGKTFGFVSTGLNIGGVIGPLLFGFLLDKGQASGVLWAAVGFMIVTTAIVLAQELNRPATGREAVASR